MFLGNAKHLNLENLVQTAKTRFFGLLKIPLIFLVGPKVVSLSTKRCEVVIPLNYITKNHVNSLYFGALAIGADLAGGLFVMEAIKASKKKVGFIFKDFQADFLQRAESDVHFICEQGEEVKALVQKAIKTKKRANHTVDIIATTPKKSGDEPVAKFKLTISVKVGR